MAPDWPDVLSCVPLRVVLSELFDSCLCISSRAELKSFEMFVASGCHHTPLPPHSCAVLQQVEIQDLVDDLLAVMLR